VCLPRLALERLRGGICASLATRSVESDFVSRPCPAGRFRPEPDGRNRRFTDGPLVAIARHEVERLTILTHASHLHYIVEMKTSTLPAVRVEPTLRSDAEAVLDEGESLSDFVASCVRDGIAWRRTQEAFLARASVAVERSEREDSGISPQEMLRQMDVRLEAARQRLAAGKPSAGQ
jgi:hypothetical protein